MKRFVALLLAVLAIFTLTACDKNKGDDQVDDPVVDPIVVVQDVEQILEDTDAFYYSVKKVHIDKELDAFVLNFFFENKSEVENIIGWEDVSVNDCMIDPSFGNAISAGKMAYSDIAFFGDLLAESDMTIEDIKKIEFTMYVMDTYAWEEVYRNTYILNF